MSETLVVDMTIKVLVATFKKSAWVLVCDLSKEELPLCKFTPIFALLSLP